MAGVNKMSALNADEWQSEASRMSMVKKLEEAIQEYGWKRQRDLQTIEELVFTRPKTREDYLNCLERFILTIKTQRTNDVRKYFFNFVLPCQHPATLST